MTPEERTVLEQLVQRHGRAPTALVPLLLAIQEHYDHLPASILDELAGATDISPAAIRGVVSYYPYFRLRPGGKHTIRVCIGTACYVKGAEQTYQAFREHLRIADDDDTDPERLFSVCKVACLGCCMLAPAVQIDDLVYGWIQPAQVPAVLKTFLAAVAARPVTPPIPPQGADRGEVKLCLCSSCLAAGARPLFEQLSHWSSTAKVPLRPVQTGCSGLSFQAPFVQVTDAAGRRFQYGRVDGDSLPSILSHHFKPVGLESAVERLLYLDLDPAARLRVDPVAPEQAVWLSAEHSIVMADSSDLSPDDLDGYRRRGGWEAAAKARTLSATDLIDHIERSGLRGRGGGGFPTGSKWRFAAAAAAGVAEKVVICNADEGDPGAFMDRMLLESVPFRVIEGIVIAAQAIQAGSAHVFVRREYPLAVQRLSQALELCRAAKLLTVVTPTGERELLISVEEGAGAFVCGEETALIAALEGRRGVPRPRPPYPSESGLFGRPTLINNVETLPTIPWIVRYGAEAFRKRGTPGSPGTKTLALAGKIKRGGLIEVPMGIRIREIIDRVGGGTSGTGDAKAVQIGGPSGGCLPAELFDVPIDYEALTETGAIMGSGGLVVLDEYDCMVDIARYFLEFTAAESCGTCSFCRVGSRRMLEILERLCDGRGRAGDLDDLERLGDLLAQGSMCGLGRTAPNPVKTTLRYFRAEYEAHLDGFCPAGKCAPLFSFEPGERCNGCMLCSRHCPVAAIPFDPWNRAVIDQEKCVRCGVCRGVCPEKAIVVTRRKP